MYRNNSNKNVLDTEYYLCILFDLWFICAFRSSASKTHPFFCIQTNNQISKQHLNTHTFMLTPLHFQISFFFSIKIVILSLSQVQVYLSAMLFIFFISKLKNSYQSFERTRPWVLERMYLIFARDQQQYKVTWKLNREIY